MTALPSSPRPQMETCPESGKVMFTKREAQTRGNELMKAGRGRLRVYCCPHCNRWHLSKQKEREIE